MISRRGEPPQIFYCLHLFKAMWFWNPIVQFKDVPQGPCFHTKMEMTTISTYIPTSYN